MSDLANLQSEIKNGFEAVKTEQKEFQRENDRRLKELESRKSDPLLVEKLEKMDVSLAKLEEKLEKTQTALNRTTSPEKEGGELKEKQKKYAEMHEKFMRKGIEKMTRDEVAVLEAGYPEEKATFLSRGSEVDGGYFVTPEMSSQITKKIFETSPMREICGSVSITTDAFEEVADWDEATVAKSNEIGTRSQQNTPQFKKLRIPVYEKYTLGYATQQVLEDAGFNLESWLGDKVVDKMGRAENYDFLNGLGVNESRGLLTYTSADSYDAVEQVASTVAGSVSADDLIGLQDTLFEPFQANASWLMKRASVSVVRKLKDGAGRYLLDMQGNLAEGYKQVLLGRPVYKGADMPAMSTGNLAVAYGDFKQGYLIVDRIGISVLRDPYSAKPYVQFYFRKRTGGGMRNFQAIKLMSIL